MYNNWTHRWEDRWYEERYTDIDYKYETVVVPSYKTVKKTRTVPHVKKVQTGTRLVEKQFPIRQWVTRDITKDVHSYTHGMIYYYIVPTKPPTRDVSVSRAQVGLGVGVIH